MYIIRGKKEDLRRSAPDFDDSGSRQKLLSLIELCRGLREYGSRSELIASSLILLEKYLPGRACFLELTPDSAAGWRLQGQHLKKARPGAGFCSASSERTARTGRLAEFFRSPILRHTSFYLLPVLNRDEIMGHLLVLSTKPLETFTLLDQQILLTFAEQLALSLKNCQLKEQAETDFLTALPNRRAFICRFRESTGRRTVIVFDLDHFKSINDRFGHDTGDEILRALGRLLREHCGLSHLCSRMGGEEFAILFQGGASEAFTFAEKLSAAMRSLPGFPVSVSASFGIASGEREFTELYRMADQAMYNAKVLGRDRVCVHQPVESRRNSG